MVEKTVPAACLRVVAGGPSSIMTYLPMSSAAQVVITEQFAPPFTSCK